YLAAPSPCSAVPARNRPAAIPRQPPPPTRNWCRSGTPPMRVCRSWPRRKGSSPRIRECAGVMAEPGAACRIAAPPVSLASASGRDRKLSGEMRGADLGARRLHEILVQVFLALVAECGDHGFQFREARADPLCRQHVRTGAGAAEQSMAARQPLHLDHRIDAEYRQHLVHQAGMTLENAWHEAVGNALDGVR